MPNKNKIHNRPELKSFRKKLRSNLTQAEAVLWRHLKNSQLEGRKFRRQHSVNNYVLDFYCPSEKLAVELDGDQHYSENGYHHDQKRSDELKELGIKVIRFENNEVLLHHAAVLEEIKRHFKN